MAWLIHVPLLCIQSCDLWSIGVIIYVMLCGYPPFYSKHHSRTIPKDMRKKIMTASFDFPEDEWSQISEMAKDIVRKYVPTAGLTVCVCVCVRQGYFPQIPPQHGLWVSPSFKQMAWFMSVVLGKTNLDRKQCFSAVLFGLSRKNLVH